ncbi:MAG: hypothetical protein ABIR84_02045 [Candidatus Nitrotoga sp.]
MQGATLLKDDFMPINFDQDNELGNEDISQSAANQIKFSGESRRRFATSGLAVSGIIFTLASRPVLGATVCTSPSGFISGNTSNHGDPPLCNGRSASDYLSSSDPLLVMIFKAAFPNSSNPSYDNRLLSSMLTTPWEPEVKLSLQVQSVQVQKDRLGAASLFLSGSSSSKKGSGSTLTKSPTTSPTTSQATIPNPPFQTQVLLKHLVVAFLNSRNGYTPFLSEGTIQSIFNEWQSSGSFSPTSGISWGADKIIEYLNLTQN